MKMNTSIIYRVFGKKQLCALIDDLAYSKILQFILNIYIGHKDLIRILADEFSAAIVKG